METTRDNSTRFGLPVLRDRSGHEGAGTLFTARRERQFMRGLLSEAGYNTNYALFRPSRFFARVLGDGVLRLNDALYRFRDEAADHILFLEGERLEAYYGELDDCIEKVRDNLVVLSDFCNKGFDGEFAAALENVDLSASEGPEELPEGGTESVQVVNSSDVSAAVAVEKPKGDVFEAVRKISVEQGILTELGRAEGWVAFHPCPFYGRFVGEIVYSFNDALLRVEGRTSFFIASGNGDALRRYYAELGKGLTGLGRDLEGIMAFCKRKVV